MTFFLHITNALMAICLQTRNKRMRASMQDTIFPLFSFCFSTSYSFLLEGFLEPDLLSSSVSFLSSSRPVLTAIIKSSFVLFLLESGHLESTMLRKGVLKLDSLSSFVSFWIDNSSEFGLISLNGTNSCSFGYSILPRLMLFQFL